MNRRLKRIRLCAGGLVLLLLGFAVVEHVRGRRALNDLLNRLKAHGEVYSVAALEPKHPPMQQNAFVELSDPARRLVSLVKHRYDAPPPVHFAAPGKEIVAWRLDQWGRNTKITNDWSTLGPEWDWAVEFLDLMHSAVQKPSYDSEFDFRMGFVDSRFNCDGVFDVTRSAQVLRSCHSL